MNANQVSATLSTADQDAVMAAIGAIRQKLSFLIDLTLDDRKTLVKYGDKSEAFVRKAIDIATQNPEMLPASFDLAELRRDAQLFDDLAPIQLAVDQLQKQIDDTAMKAGSEAYAAARVVYACLKSGFGRTDLTGVAGELGQRFIKRTPAAAVTPVPAAPAVPPVTPQP